MSNQTESKYTKFFAKLKEAFSELKTESTPETQTFGTSKLATGETLTWDGNDPMPGLAVTVTTLDGQTLPAPDGEYTLPENGTVLEIEGGVIASVVPADAASTDTAAPAQPANPAANTGMSDIGAPVAKEITERIEKVSKFAEDEIAALKENVKQLSESFAAAVEENKALNAEIEKQKVMFSQFAKVVDEAIAEIGEQPQVIDTVEQNFREEVKPSVDLNEWRKQLWKK